MISREGIAGSDVVSLMFPDGLSRDADNFMYLLPAVSPAVSVLGVTLKS